MTLLLLALAFLRPVAAADQNWVALHVFDSYYPMTAEQTFPEALSSLETIYQLYTTRSIKRDLLKTRDVYGARSREGHFLIQIHLSSEFLATHAVDRKALGEQLFLFADRETDIFSAWSGSVNLAAFLTHGVHGLGMPLPKTGGGWDGNFQTFNDIWPLGDADFEGGWYMNDEQAARILTAFQTYPGIAAGYTFMRPIEDKPNVPFEPENAQLVNGYNCGDFAFYALTEAGVVSREEVESFKVDFWYPWAYFDRTPPLKGVGAAGRKWLDHHPGVTQIPGNIMTQLGWAQLLFSPYGLEFFDKKAIAREITGGQLRLNRARIWDQAHAIEWLKNRAEFRTKGIATEVFPLWRSGGRLDSPVRTIEPTPKNRFTLTRTWSRAQAQGDRLQARKLGHAGLSGVSGDAFRALYETLKDR